ncbi:hypothetical protein OOJ91_12130 [Micromonospora lupini]|uniref:hypothetical protein n=1 Tax=Micromonospora lupini TaxID=285679 RepID=UPI002254F142|nr:hypothetical protein [Micromonospora lupini]MCX5066626.1 hypothetical protein [Micromonospora lupini]
MKAARLNTAPPPRCRLDLLCDRTTDDLAIRPVRLHTGAVAPTLCCEACANHINQPADVGHDASVPA